MYKNVNKHLKISKYPSVTNLNRLSGDTHNELYVNTSAPCQDLGVAGRVGSFTCPSACSRS